ncbi:protein RIC-3b precursor [Danio rerio]|uniref:Protein RIC-3b precursor n=1 Tax=Danio rerio TaxID=7955 RepID=Q6DHE0_DANRE|nr:protein RIC-3b precursor [Danio rerio]AAH76034.1 Zgc:92489 [Danio rerio]|eukprot:NP_001002381.1 zgc:92489 precursor [Danio rerio]
MSISTFQKLTVVSCVLLCVALLLPKMLLSRGHREPDGPAGNFPPVPQRGPLSDERRSRQSSRTHTTEAIARARGAGAAATGKSNLAGQIIPIYGFGILLYILYILFKITAKGRSSTPPESRLSAVRAENTKRKITDFELAQLQDRLNETKDMIERILSTASTGSDSAAVPLDEEQNLLFQLQEITRVMQEGRLVDTADPPDHLQEHFCCVHPPDTHTHTPMEDVDDTHTPLAESDQTLMTESDDKHTHTPMAESDSVNTAAQDASISQSQPQTDTQTGSDITGLRRRNKP